jgi:hypothetical protein
VYSEDLGPVTSLPGQKSGRVTFYVITRGAAKPFSGRADVVRTSRAGDVSVPITSSAAKKLGC